MQPSSATEMNPALGTAESSAPATARPRLRRTRKERPASTELLQAMVLGDEPKFDPFTGADLEAGEVRERSLGAKAGLEAPRFCQICGRRMVVQIRPTGWTAKCSRHGEVDSIMLEQR